MKRGVSGFRPERLNQALDARGMSQVQLATLADVSAGSISKWRNGLQEPTADALDKLAKAVNVKPEWFLRAATGFDTGIKLFRSNASALKSARAYMSVRHDWSKELAAEFGEFVEYPEVNFPVREYKDPNEVSDEDIEVAAAECRKIWKLGLGPVPDVVLAIENAGGIVVREATDKPRIEGVSSWCSVNERPFVYLNADKANGFRSRFDAAHELGHVILHRHVQEDVARANYRLMEDQAHYFAGAFLLPGETFANEVSGVPSLDTLLALKLRWKTSAAAMIKRLSVLEILDEQAELNLWKRRSARFGNKAEPYDDELTPEQPRLLKRAVTLLVEEGVNPRETIPDRVGLSAKDVEGLAGMPEDYFAPDRGQVIDLAAVRLRRGL